RVKSSLANRDIQPRILSTLLRGLTVEVPVEDVRIVKLVGLPPGQTIFDVTRALRSELSGEEAKVSPNHVLIPAAEGHSCPMGPPEPAPAPPVTQPSGPPPNVTLIDSGYIWQPGWGANPLGAYSDLHQHYAQWLPANPSTVSVFGVFGAGGWGP